MHVRERGADPQLLAVQGVTADGGVLLDFKHARKPSEAPPPESLSLRKLRISESRKHGLSEQKAAKQLQNLAQVLTCRCGHEGCEAQAQMCWALLPQMPVIPAYLGCLSSVPLQGWPRLSDLQSHRVRQHCDLWPAAPRLRGCLFVSTHILLYIGKHPHVWPCQQQNLRFPTPGAAHTLSSCWNHTQQA